MSKLQETAPEEIFLIVGPTEETDFKELTDVTWADKPIYEETAIKYVKHPKLSIPKKIAEHDWMKHLIECGNLSQFEFERYDDCLPKDDEQFLEWVKTDRNENILYIYLASKALGVELVEVTDE